MRSSVPAQSQLISRSLTGLLVLCLLVTIGWSLNRLGLVVGWPAVTSDPLRAATGFSTIFLGIFIEAVPFVLLGVVVSAVLHLAVSEERLARLLPRQPALASLTGALLGLVFPVCECGVVPVSRRLMSKGAPVSLGVAFLLAAPVVNPIVIASTWVAFGGDWRIVGWRVGLTLVIAAVVGLVFMAHPQPRSLLVDPGSPGGSAVGSHDQHDQRAQPGRRGHQTGDRLREIIWHSGAEFVEMSRFLIMGALLAAAMQTLVPRASLLALGSTPIAATLVMVGLAVVLSVCSTVDAFLALSFAGTFTTGSILAFLVFGPMIDVKSTMMFLGVFQRRAVAVIILLAFQMVLLASLFITLTWG